jgi:hypothetical protein
MDAQTKAELEAIMSQDGRGTAALTPSELQMIHDAGGVVDDSEDYLAGWAWFVEPTLD